MAPSTIPVQLRPEVVDSIFTLGGLTDTMAISQPYNDILAQLLGIYSVPQCLFAESITELFSIASIG